MSWPRRLVVFSLLARYSSAQYVGYQAYDPTQLEVPPLPATAPPLAFEVALDYGGSPTAGPETPGSFLGVSIEMVLVEDIVGPSKDKVHPEFLNFMAGLKARGGSPVLRLGGNSQEKAELVASLDGVGTPDTIAFEGDGQSVKKLINPGFNTLTMVYTADIVDAMRAASDALDIHWYIGITMNQTMPPRLEFVELAQERLGDYLLSMQLGNEPDLYYMRYRPNDGSYTPQAYITEVQMMLDTMKADPKITRPNICGGPSLCDCNGDWKQHDIFHEIGYIDKFRDSLNTLFVMKYPSDNCPGEASYRPTAQDFLNLLTQHDSKYGAKVFGSRFSSQYQVAQEAGLPLVLLETNTASCNGFLGVSDSFGAGLWVVDTALQFASNGLQHMMLHLGGQTSYYNPFINAPANSSAPHKWTVNPLGYSMLFVAEALGPSNKARVADIGVNGGNAYTPGYTIYEDNKPVRVALINYMTDATGAHDYTASIKVDASVTEVYVRSYSAESTTSKAGSGLTWAGQTFGGYFETDGTLQGTQTTETVPCSGGTCAVKVKAPSAAIVFLSKTNMYDASTSPAQTFDGSATPTSSGSNPSGTTAGGGGGGGNGAASSLAVGVTSFIGSVVAAASIMF
ncbi:hypothetical protein BKA62DRAFT_620958 [Auriculariales sp. MPI-PUGE-AT-0066]|nr:hypothetical protein BKA62DRAFT_620958 [Auriculariales sp. MPI-PUGE-AT-0066]